MQSQPKDEYRKRANKQEGSEKRGDPWRVDEFDQPHDVQPSDCFRRPVVQTPKQEKPPRAKQKNNDCCELLIGILKQLPGYQDADVHKPKQSVKVKTANLCGMWYTKDNIVPVLMLLLRRFLSKATPANLFESTVQQFLADLPEKKLHALRIGLDAYHRLPAGKRECIFETRFDDADDEALLDPDFIFKTWLQQAIRFGRGQLYDQPGGTAGPGKVRPWEQKFAKPPNGGGIDTVTAPWPWICAVNPGADGHLWYKNMEVTRPGNIPLDQFRFEPYEFSLTCTSQPDPSRAGHVEIKCDYERPSGGGLFASPCNGDVRYNYPWQGGTVCLTIPKTYPGQGIALRGLNFFSSNCTVRLKKLDSPPFQDIVLPCSVMGDQETPELRDGKPVASCEVRDQITFTIPERVRSGLNDIPVPPGRYSVEVHVPNEIGYAPTAGTAPPEFVSNTVWLDMQPNPNQRFRVWSDEAFCIDETSPAAFGSDEPWFRAVIARWVPDGSQNAPFISFVDIMKTDDVDSGEWISMPVAELFRDALKQGEVIGISVIGLEVDSEEAAKEQIDSFGEAYVEYWKQVYTQVSSGTAGSFAGKGLATLVDTGQITASLVGGGIALGVIAALGILYALWAPADPIGYDFMVYDALTLYKLTDPAQPIPGPMPDQKMPDSITLRVTPKSKQVDDPGGTQATYSEDHYYMSDDQGSNYRLVYRFGRV